MAAATEASQTIRQEIAACTFEAEVVASLRVRLDAAAREEHMGQEALASANQSAALCQSELEAMARRQEQLVAQGKGQISSSEVLDLKTELFVALPSESEIWPKN